ncbi:hypothetical protein BS638_06475 [Clostridium tepidum]|uniref:Phage scaffold protein n=1 Tax=Clostridium tepidum TaxID=1962263 RepID=A0A1S9I921_9CLOT|nr:DUF4355 domain-containing protein [Clostridium tepidum]OOO66766.1 hypothetical protein BS638_06475 [Clostridium tepidum]
MEDNKNLDTNTNTDIDNKESSAVDSTKKDTTNKDVATDNKEDKQEKTFTQEELDKIIEKRLARALKKADEERQEAEKLAKMSEAERQQALFDKEKAKFEEERKQYQREKMELEVIKQMSSKGLPVEFSKYLIADDAETALNNIKTFEVEWQQAIEKAVNEKLKGNTPKAGNTTNITITKDEFNSLGYSERMKIYNEQPELYKELTK